MTTKTITIKNVDQLRGKDLRETYKTIFGEAPKTKDKPLLVRRIRARLREMPIMFGQRKPPRRAAVTERDPRLPAPGAILVREIDGVRHEVKVHEKDFEYMAGKAEMVGKRYPTLSTIARLVTGTIWNGFVFFHLEKYPPHRKR